MGEMRGMKLELKMSPSDNDSMKQSIALKAINSKLIIKKPPKTKI
jgi:hypothetical protein